MFEDSTFSSNGVLRNQTPKWMLAALGFNLLLISAAIVVPLLYPEILPSRVFPSDVYVPAPGAETQAQPHAAQHSSAPSRPMPNPYLVPILTNTSIALRPVGGDSTVGEPGDPVSMTDGVAGSTGLPQVFRPAQPAVVHPAQPDRIAVSTGVAEGLLLTKTIPRYPPIAKVAGVQGTVTLAATISRDGTIEDLRVLSGHPMLCGAALEAVKTWRYRPYLLNGQPVEVETTINVVFSMAGR